MAPLATITTCILTRPPYQVTGQNWPIYRPYPGLSCVHRRVISTMIQTGRKSSQRDTTCPIIPSWQLLRMIIKRSHYYLPFSGNQHDLVHLCRQSHLPEAFTSRTGLSEKFKDDFYLRFRQSHHRHTNRHSWCGSKPEDLGLGDQSRGYKRRCTLLDRH